MLQLSVREKEILEKPDEGCISEIVAHVAAGGYLEDLCKTWGISFGKVRAWMMENAERDKAYIGAMNARAELETERLKREMMVLALRRSAQAFKTNADGSRERLPVEQWPEELLNCIDSIETFDDGRVKSVKLVSREAALGLAARTLGMLRDKVSVDGKVSFEDMVVAADRVARAQIVDAKTEPLGLPEGNSGT